MTPPPSLSKAGEEGVSTRRDEIWFTDGDAIRLLFEAYMRVRLIRGANA